MKDKIIAKNYANAFFDLLISKSLLEDLKKDVSNLKNVFLNNKEFAILIKNPTIDYKDIASVFDVFKKNGLLHEFSSSLLKLLAKNKRLSLLNLVINEVSDLINNYENIIIGQIYLAIDIDDGLLKEIEGSFSKKLNKNIKLEKIIDKSLVGGYYLKLGHEIYDASIKTKLSSLRNSIISFA